LGELLQTTKETLEMKKFYLAPIASALVLSSSAAIANGHMDKLYGVIGYQQTELDENTSILSNVGVSVDDNDSGFNFGIGYEVNEFFSIEAGYVDLGSLLTASGSASAGGTAGSGTLGGYNYSYTSNLAATATATVDVDGWTLGGVFKYPATEQLDLFAKAGLFNWDGTGSASATITTGTLTVDGSNYTGTHSVGGEIDGTDAFYGVGLSYDVNDSIAIRADYTRYKFDAYNTTVDADAFGAALVAKF
jgi:OOP family OmpA-OmpF porin